VHVINVVLDATECPIQRPHHWYVQSLYYSGKKKRHTIKYEIGIHLLTGRIVWIAGPIPGSTHDITLCRRSGILTMLLPGEFIMADKGYIGEAQIITPFKTPTTTQKLFNSQLGQLRVIVENTYGRVKHFRCLKHEWTHDLSLHPLTFYFICQLVNLDVIFHPLRQ